MEKIKGKGGEKKAVTLKKKKRETFELNGGKVERKCAKKRKY